MLYVEHELLPDAFPGGRIKILAMLSSQIAISIENSALYEQVRPTLHSHLETASYCRTALFDARNFDHTPLWCNWY